MTGVGLLHTVPALAGTFDAMIAERAGGLDRLHISEARLLQTAIAEGVTDAVRERVAAHIRSLEADGVDAILVTCSSIGEAAEEAGASVNVPVVRVDAAMAREAVRLTAAVAATGRTGRIMVLATNTATLGPTTRLIEREAAAAGEPIEVIAAVVEGAVAARDSGDPAEHDRLIAEAVAVAAGSADTIVLAQASMAAAASHAETRIPILTSPEGGVDDLLAVLASQKESGS
jgi:aspartate/glutamate racemase